MTNGGLNTLWSHWAQFIITSQVGRLVSVFSVYSFTKAPSYFWVLSVDLRNVLCQLCPRFKTRWIIHTIFIFNICNNLSSRHEETLTITRVPDCLNVLNVTYQCLRPRILLTISIFQNVRMMRFMHRHLGRLWILRVGISSCFSEAFETNMWAMLWERGGERRRAISKNYRESNKRSFPNSSDDFYFCMFERVLEKRDDKQKYFCFQKQFFTFCILAFQFINFQNEYNHWFMIMMLSWCVILYFDLCKHFLELSHEPDGSHLQFSGLNVTMIPR